MFFFIMCLLYVLVAASVLCTSVHFVVSSLKNYIVRQKNIFVIRAVASGAKDGDDSRGHPHPPERKEGTTLNQL